jgi:hypothetical protein
MVGRTPWSARVPLDPLFVSPFNKPTGGSTADQGVRPTVNRSSKKARACSRVASIAPRGNPS